jgi:putative Mg2+ transporter-C (MgtC) family protein
MGAPDMNTTRIAAQVVTGIGFLGAGAILRNRNSVFGLTTAATIWAVAAIGMAVGFGEFGLAAMGTLAILVALFIFNFVERWVGTHRDIQIYDFVAPNEDDIIARVDTMFKDARLKARKRTCYQDEDDLVIHVRAMGAKANHEKLRVSLARSKEYRLRRS